MPGASDLQVVYQFYRNNGVKESLTKYILWIEVKTIVGQQSKAQKEFEKHIRQMGMEYHVVRSLERFKELLPTELKIIIKE